MALERDKHTAQRALLTLQETQLFELYRRMVLIRQFEEKTAEMYARGKITGFCHLYAGEEAVAVGAIYALYDKDYVVSTYREHGHCLAKGADPKVVMAELFGRITGISKGRGGSMHLFDPDLRFMGGYAIVGGGLPIATGLGLPVEAAGGVRLREQLLRHGDDGAERHLPGRAVPVRRALQDAGCPGGRHGCARSLRRHHGS